MKGGGQYGPPQYYFGGYGGAGATIAGACLTNAGTIMGGQSNDIESINGVGLTGGTLINTGTVLAHASFADSDSHLEYDQHVDGVSIGGSGVVVNGSANSQNALIEGYEGVYAHVISAVTVTNFGTIDAPNHLYDVDSAAVEFHGGSGGVIVNGAVNDQGALMEGNYGVSANATSALTVVNYGVIDGIPGRGGGSAAVAFTDGSYGEIVNGSANDQGALIEGGQGVSIGGGDGDGVTVTNFGTIEGTAGSAVSLSTAADRLIAEVGSLFEGAASGGGGTLELAGGTGTITNLGGAGAVSGSVALTFSGFGAYDLDVGGVWTLAGGSSLAAGQFLDITGGELLVVGTLAAVGNGVSVGAAGGVIVNGSAADPGAHIKGAVGVYAGAAGAATVTNFGTIDGTGGTAVVFEHDLDRLVAEAGSTFIGSVVGGGGTLELAGGTGTITNLGATGSVSGAEAISFSGFNYFHLDAGGNWTLAGARLAAGQSLRIDAGASATVVGGGALILAGGALGVNGTLDITGGPGAASLDVEGANTLKGGGTVVLSANGRVVAGDATAALTNAATLAGAGVIGGKLTLDNAAGGVIDASTGYLEISLKGAAFANGGMVETTGPGTLLVAGATIANTGTVSASKPLELYRSTIAGGKVLVAAGGVLKGVDGAISGAKITNAGTLAAAKGGLVITGAVTNTGLLLADGGNLTITGAVTGAGQARIAGDTLEVDGALGETVTFAASGPGTLILGDSAAFTGKVVGFSKTGANRIDLKDIAYSATDTVAYSATTGALTISNASHAVLATIKLSGNYAGSTFLLKNGGADGTVIIDPKATAFASAAAGLGAVGASSGTATLHPPTPLLSLLAHG